jgi:hypothetical protein
MRIGGRYGSVKQGTELLADDGFLMDRHGSMIHNGFHENLLSLYRNVFERMMVWPA